MLQVAVTQIRREAERIQRQMQKEVWCHPLDAILHTALLRSHVHMLDDEVNVDWRLQEAELRACTFKPQTKKLPAYISRMAASHRARKAAGTALGDRTSSQDWM